MGLFTKWKLARYLRIQEGEIFSFTAQLRQMDADEIGMVVALATDARNRLEEAGFILSDPIGAYTLKPETPAALHGMILSLQAEGKLQEAAALMVWLHTARVGARIELRPLAREMWRQLERGFPHAQEASRSLMRTLFRSIRLDGYDQFPKGLSPDPL
ncbi:hypothetical protein E3Z27_18725 [Pseudomonas mediterranea]|uniref:hypothetical protein n=1 Tax=Pseudomonas mediterranea TaxID=183795 RepID=UPI001317E46A|nr:hypothetical protein [Pseudomonas mediterranea]QHA83566.1 hypothetical protein E3Z27_18725 [Pseudomonas mediterranea]